MTFLIVLLGWLFSLCLHEFCHAAVAYLGGDTSVREKGYLTFNPLRYTHPVYSLILPMVFLLMGGIGLPGGAVYIETWRLRSKRWESAVALAGPASNILLALVLGLILRFAPISSTGIWPGLGFLALLQVMAAVLNLLPIPPLDGYRAIAPLFDDGWRATIDRFASFTMIAFFLALWYVPNVSEMFWWYTNSLAEWIGIPLHLAYVGLRAFFFWQ